MRILTFLILSSFIVPLQAQSVKATLDAIVRTDKEYFIKYFANEVAFSVDQEEQSLTKEQAIEKLKAFVAATSIKSNKIIHEGVAKGKDGYMGIGSLISDKGKFRVYISFKNVDGSKVIQELKLEKDVL